MRQTEDEQAGRQRPRYALVDVVRGIAIIGVVFYHFAWDLRFFNIITTAVDVAPGWFFFARTLLATFLFLTGVSLVLAHGAGIRWRPFWKRFAILAAAALLVSLGTYIFAPDAFVYFGVLHAIALFSVMGLVFLRAPLWLVGGLAIVMFAAYFSFQSPVFNSRALSWIGFWTVPPLTEDLVPVFPGFGFTLLGILLTRLALLSGFAARIAAVSANGRVLGALKQAGRWSLIIYLVHQPILLGILTPLAPYLAREDPAERATEFFGACFSSCLETEGNATQCRAYCNCALEQVETGDLWGALNAQGVSQNPEIGAVINLCRAMSFELDKPLELLE